MAVICDTLQHRTYARDSFGRRPKKYLEVGRVLEVRVKRAGICRWQELFLHRFWDVKSAAARNPESNCSGGFKLNEPGRTTTPTPERLREANWRTFCLSLKARKYILGFDEEGQPIFICYDFRTKPTRDRQRPLLSRGSRRSLFAIPYGELIMETMARGWESKSVEAQQDEARQGAPQSRTRLTPEEAARSRERENLRLSRQRVVQQIESSQNPRHRKGLEDALAELDQKLGQFEK